MKPRALEMYVTADGVVPFDRWLSEHRDARVIGEIFAALDDLARGEFSRCASVGNGVFERRIGRREVVEVYFALIGDDVLLLLSGGTQQTRKNDSARALNWWKEFKEHAH